MAILLKERWTESEVAALPPGEQDYFERKSGALLSDSAFREKLGKAVSAFANSGGGHIILGVTDDGQFDGLEPYQKGRATTREWLEQLLPNLVAFPLRDFRVHEVETIADTSIPPGKKLVVIDIGDSTQAPHQEEQKKIYYCRQGGHSVPAPHFYLETLRNRLVGPDLIPKLVGFGAEGIDRLDNSGLNYFVQGKLSFNITNHGRIAAYKWELDVTYSSEGTELFASPASYPVALKNRNVGIQLDRTVLPTLTGWTTRDLGFKLQLGGIADDMRPIIASALRAALSSVTISYRAVSEISPGEPISTHLLETIDLNNLSVDLDNRIRGLPRLL